MTMTLRLSNESNWTHEDMIITREGQSVGRIAPGEHVDVYPDPYNGGEPMLIEVVAERDDDKSVPRTQEG